MLFCSLPVVAPAQVDIPDTFSKLLDSLHLRFTAPIGSDFRAQKSSENRYLVAQYILRSRREKLEMRFYLQPDREDDRYFQLPHIAAATLAMNLGSNDEDAVTAVHGFDDEELALYQADWARMYTFRPKRAFSDKQQAQMIAIYHEGRGMAYTFLLFDRPPDTLEGRQLTLRFR